MSNDILAISDMQIAGVTVATADARELHVKLGVSRDFNLWVTDQIKRARLVAKRDYLTYENVVQMPSGAKRRKECALTLDAAKHIAMMTGTERGFEIREFFIEREKMLSEIEKAARAAIPDFSDPVAAARAWADEAEARRNADRALEQAKPAIEFVEKYAEAATGNKTFRQVCKLLGANESRFREFLVDRTIVYYLNGEMTPFANHLDAGRFSVKAGVSNHSEHAYNHMTFTPKGVTWIAGEWGKHIADLNQQAMQQRATAALSHAHV